MYMYWQCPSWCLKQLQFYLLYRWLYNINIYIKQIISFSFQRVFHHLLFSLQWLRVIPKSPIKGLWWPEFIILLFFYAHQTIQWLLMPCNDASPHIYHGLPFICRPSERKYRTSQINLTSSWIWPQVQCSSLSKL